MHGKKGSMHWVPPEVWENARFQGPEADVWAMGVMAYALCSGKLPFPGESYEDVRQLVLERARRPPEIPLHFSEKLTDFVSRIFSCDPLTRVTSAKALLRHPWLKEVGLKVSKSHPAMLPIASSSQSSALKSFSDSSSEKKQTRRRQRRKR